MDFTRTFRLPKYQNFVFALVIYLAANPSSFAVSSDALVLEQDYQNLTARIFNVLSKKLSECQGKVSTLQALSEKLKQLTEQSRYVTGICLLQNHKEVLKENIDSKEIFFIFSYLLEHNYLSLAEKLFAHAKEEGDKSLISNISFLFGRYYVEHQDWGKVLKFTKGIYNDLTFENANLARLYNGIALQKLKKHRKAVKTYIKVPEHSAYYPVARLNIATAYIRQDWWTDAHIKINDVIKNNKIKTNNEMVNRLYMVLGYSLLNKEFYRDAREAFRNIEIDSRYFNKALLGISLAAINQQDYVGALNAINILRKKKAIDLSVDESHLLLPYIYEKLNQNITASASYSDALKYYQSRIDNVKAIKTANQQPFKLFNKFKKDRPLEINDNIIEYSRHFTEILTGNTGRLNKLANQLAQIKNNSLINEFKQVKSQHNKYLNKTLDKIYDARIAYLNSYMNQARFGLARLFDNSSSAKN